MAECWYNIVDGSAVVQKLAFKHEQLKQARKVVDLSHHIFIFFV